VIDFKALAARLRQEAEALPINLDLSSFRGQVVFPVYGVCGGGPESALAYLQTLWGDRWPFESQGGPRSRSMKHAADEFRASILRNFPPT
jgi:hypothetical protein